MFRLNRWMGGCVLVIFAAGCGIKAETYVMTKDRVGIENKGGNAGYLAGTPQYKEPQRKTRKVYVLELSKPVPESEVRKIEQETTVSRHETNTGEAPNNAPAEQGPEGNARVLITPVLDGPAVSAPAAEPAFGPKEAVSYTVLKDDTLQKIAKKFYNSYGKWVKIYDANKEKIKNPNFVKPGTILTIPPVG